MSERPARAPRELTPLVLLGLLLVTLSTLLALWPADQAGAGAAGPVPHVQRLIGLGAGGQPGLDWLLRRAMDAANYVAVLAGYGLVVVDRRRPDRRWLLGLVGVGGFGLIYTGGLVLYPGPMIAAMGYLLVTVSAGFMWLVARPAEPEPETGTNEDYGTHPAA